MTRPAPHSAPPLRRLLGLLLAATLLVGWPAAAHAGEGGEGGGGDDNSAVAVNTRDGSDLFRLAFSIRRVMSGPVEQTNTAVAYASCEDCQTVAIAFQVVLVSHDPETVAPENVAVAVNEECTSCETLASAYQFVIGVDGPVRFTGEGNRRIAQIRRDLQALRRSDGSIEEIQAEVDRLADELRDVLDTELVEVGRPADPDDRCAEDGGGDAPSAPGGNAAGGPPRPNELCVQEASESASPSEDTSDDPTDGEATGEPTEASDDTSDPDDPDDDTGDADDETGDDDQPADSDDGNDSGDRSTPGPAESTTATTTPAP